MKLDTDHVRIVEPDTFEPAKHFYPRVLNAQIHPLVRYFMSLGNERIAERYCHLHPEVEPDAVRRALSHKTQHFRWGGTDLMYVTDEQGLRSMVVIETNSSPSGQKSMPLYEEDQEMGGYRTLLERSFMPLLSRRGSVSGGLAVLWDKNELEVSGYAAALAEISGEPVALVPFFKDDPDPKARFTDGVLEILQGGQWRPMRAAFRYVTQRPWDRIPALSRTHVFNPVVVCLAGGRNKLLAAKAYDLSNAAMHATGLTIRVPETIWDVSLEEVPMWVTRMGGVAVVKVPYSNAGQGVYTIVGQSELDAFMAQDHPYDRFIVQALIGNSGWSSRSRAGRRLFHVGTMPNRRNELYVADLRFMVGVGAEGFYPVAVYARRARAPLVRALSNHEGSWDMLGTNLSVKGDDGQWTTESERLMLMDRRDFNHLGLGLDHLIEGYLQSALAVTSIDDMACRLVNKKRQFRRRRFASLNTDPALLGELKA